MTGLSCLGQLGMQKLETKTQEAIIGEVIPCRDHRHGPKWPKVEDAQQPRQCGISTHPTQPKAVRLDLLLR